MITKLTPEQEAQLTVYAEKWRKIFLSTEPTDHVTVENAINRIYQTLGYDQPIEIIWFDSPMAMSKEWKKLGQSYSILNNHSGDFGVLRTLFEKFDKMIAVQVQQCPTEARDIVSSVLRAILDITKNRAPPIFTHQTRLSMIFLYNLCNEVFSFDRRC
jgi:hypothetical protein